MVTKEQQTEQALAEEVSLLFHTPGQNGVAASWAFFRVCYPMISVQADTEGTLPCYYAMQ